MTSYDIQKSAAFGLTQNDVAYAEKILNIAGYVPGVRNITSGFRGTLAGIEAIYGVASAAYKFGQGCANIRDADARSAAFAKSYKELVYVGHAVANYVRSEVESSWYLPSLVATAIWDLKGMRLKYAKEEGSGHILTMGMITKNVEWLRNKIQAGFDVMA